MKKIITLFVLPLFIGGVFAFQSVGGNEKLEKFSSKAHASAGGNQAGLTGAPAENNCTQCHSGSVLDGSTENQILVSFSNKKIKQGYLVESVFKLASVNSKAVMSYLIQPNGSVRVTHSFDYGGSHDKTEIPRVGLNMQLSSSLENVEWYGRGQNENYIDRKASAFMGSYSAKVNEMKFDYGRPQENGYRTQTKHLSLTDKNGN